MLKIMLHLFRKAVASDAPKVFVTVITENVVCSVSKHM